MFLLVWMLCNAPAQPFVSRCHEVRHLTYETLELCEIAKGSIQLFDGLGRRREGHPFVVLSCERVV